MRELLKRWAAIEPDRLEIGKWGVELVYDGETYGSTLLLQLAVQEAITARGWSIRLEIGPESTNGHVTTDCSVGGEVYASTPAEVALTAYLNALEALAQ